MQMKNFTPDLTWDPLSLFTDERIPGTVSYPPYNSYTLKGHLYIELAVAGFTKEELNVEFAGGRLTITGDKKKNESPFEINYIHRGLAYRRFSQTFTILPSHEFNGVTLVNGVLVVDFKPVESKQVNKIDIGTSTRHPAFLPDTTAINTARELANKFGLVNEQGVHVKNNK